MMSDSTEARIFFFFFLCLAWQTNSLNMRSCYLRSAISGAPATTPGFLAIAAEFGGQQLDRWLMRNREDHFCPCDVGRAWCQSLKIISRILGKKSKIVPGSALIVWNVTILGPFGVSELEIQTNELHWVQVSYRCYIWDFCFVLVFFADLKCMLNTQLHRQ